VESCRRSWSGGFSGVVVLACQRQLLLPPTEAEGRGGGGTSG
jgi:hypothetical protein